MKHFVSSSAILPYVVFGPWYAHPSKAEVWPDCSQRPSVRPCQGIKLTDLHEVRGGAEVEQKRRRIGLVKKKVHRECRVNARLRASG